jgi:hypothetical protein
LAAAEPRGRTSLPPLRERAIRVSVLESLHLAERDILPTALRLLENDLLRTASFLAENVGVRRAAQKALREFDGETVRGILAEASLRPTPVRYTPPPGFSELALELIEAWLSDWRSGGQCLGEPLVDPEDHLPTDEPLPPAPSAAASEAGARRRMPMTRHCHKSRRRSSG